MPSTSSSPSARPEKCSGKPARSPNTRGEIEAALAEAIERQTTSSQGIVMPSSSWVISAVNPAQ
jgi:hypothetical protein